MTTRSADECEMSRSCQSATFSSADDACRAHDAREAADPLGDDRVALVRHRRRALLALAERLLDLAHLGAREVADLDARTCSSEDATTASAASSSACRSRWTTCVDDRLGLEPEALARDALDLGIDRRVRADRARRACRRACPRARARAASRPRSSSNAQPASFSAEGRRLGVDAVRAADAERVAGAPRARATTAVEALVEPVEQQRARLLDLQRERGVDDVRRGEAVVEPAADRAELLGDRVDEGRQCRGAGLAPRAPRRAPGDGGLARSRISATDVGGNDADLGPAFERRELDLEPAREPALVRPDPAMAGRE